MGSTQERAGLHALRPKPCTPAPQLLSDLRISHRPTLPETPGPPSQAAAKLIRRPDLVLCLVELAPGTLCLSRLPEQGPAVCVTGMLGPATQPQGRGCSRGREEERMEDGEGDRKG